MAELPNANTIVVADDAHHYGDLDKLISLVSSRIGERRLKLVIATRPSGQADTDELLARLADESVVIPYKALRELGKSAIVEIAKEMLGPIYAHLAEWLAEVSKDTPLITVVGGKLIAKGQITPNSLANDQEFRRTVFNKFAEECVGQLPAGGRSKRELLELIASVQPIDEQEDNFAAKASVFLSLRPDEIRRGFGALQQTEIVVRGGGKLRIVPDLFADYLLETASVGGSGKASGFADWSSISTRFRAQNAAERTHFIREVKDITVFQPVNVEKLIQIAMDDEAQPVKQWGFRAVDAREPQATPSSAE